jgi:hypothetical protein
LRFAAAAYYFEIIKKIIDMEKIEKSFGDCRLSYLEKTFGLRQVRTMNALTDWQLRASVIEPLEKEISFLGILQELLIVNASWNEQELSLHFVGPMFSLINFTEPYRFNLFAERFISATIDSLEHQPVMLMGKPDEFIASGYREPEIPFFCFNEFKRETEIKGDPAGQALAAMMVGQALNENHTPTYGCYIIGRDWYFMTLLDKQYSISQDFSTVTDDIFEVLRMLKALKEIVKELTA